MTQQFNTSFQPTEFKMPFLFWGHFSFGGISFLTRQPLGTRILKLGGNFHACRPVNYHHSQPYFQFSHLQKIT